MRKAIATALLATLSLAASAQAEPRRNGPATIIQIGATGCETDVAQETSFLRLLEIELAGERVRFVRYNVPPGLGELVVEVRWAACGTSSREAVITLRRLGYEKIERTIALGDLASDARPRTLSLAVAELIHSTRAAWKREAEAVLGIGAEPAEPARPEPVAEPAPPPPVIVKVPDMPDQKQAAPPSSGLWLQASGAARTFVSKAIPVFGAQAAVTFPVSEQRFFMRVDVNGWWSSADDALGTVRMSSYTGGAAFFLATRTNPVLYFGPRLEVGHVGAEATSNQTVVAGTSTGNLFGAASLLGSLRVVKGRVALVLEAEGGTAFEGFTLWSEGRKVATTRGAFVTGRVGLAVAY
jgi:hypothetical protein